MKRMSQIAQELRSNGRKFSQTAFRKDLEEFTPVFEEGKVVFYDDSVIDALMNRYRVHVCVEAITAKVEEENSTSIEARLSNIEAMLTNMYSAYVTQQNSQVAQR